MKSIPCGVRCRWCRVVRISMRRDRRTVACRPRAVPVKGSSGSAASSEYTIARRRAFTNTIPRRRATFSVAGPLITVMPPRRPSPLRRVDTENVVDNLPDLGTALLSIGRAGRQPVQPSAPAAITIPGNGHRCDRVSRAVNDEQGNEDICRPDAVHRIRPRSLSRLTIHRGNSVEQSRYAEYSKPTDFCRPRLLPNVINPCGNITWVSPGRSRHDAVPACTLSNLGKDTPRMW
jgi:hypothetical protein